MLKTALKSVPALMLGVLTVPVTTAQTPAKVDFARDVQPLLRANCYSCHGSSLQSGGFRLDLRRDSMPNRVGNQRSADHSRQQLVLAQRVEWIDSRRAAGRDRRREERRQQ